MNEFCVVYSSVSKIFITCKNKIGPVINEITNFNLLFNFKQKK